MALTRKFLSAMGIEADKIDEIITAHTDTVDALKEERDNAKADAQKYKADADKLPDIQKELDDLKNTNSGDPYKQKYEDEHKAFEDYKADVKAKETLAKQKDAYKQILKNAGIADKYIDAVLGVSDFKSLEFEEDGKVKDADKLASGIKEKFSDFVVKEKEQGANVSTPPDGTGSGKRSSLAAQRVAEYRKNMYGSVKED